MAKAGSSDKTRSKAARADTRQRIVSAAIEALKQQGFVGASARAIADIGDFNQALIFYHFGTVNDLLLAALDETSRQRMVRYEELVARANSLGDLVAVAAEVYREDLESGHVTVLAEMIAGSISDPELGAQVAARMEPWFKFTREVAERFLGDLGLSQLFPADDVAYGVVALYLGMEMLSHLDRGHSGPESLFATSTRLAMLFSGLSGGKGIP